MSSLQTCSLAILFLLLSICEGVKVQDASKQVMVAGLVSEAESTSAQLSQLTDQETDTRFDLNQFNSGMADLLVDMFRIQSTEDSMYNIIYYKCDKNTDMFQFQVDFDKSDLERILNNKALCELQNNLAQGDEDVCDDLVEVTEMQDAALQTLINGRDDYYNGMTDYLKTLLDALEKAQALVDQVLNEQDSSTVMESMLQIRSTSKKILSQIAQTGKVPDKALTLIGLLKSTHNDDKSSNEANPVEDGVGDYSTNELVLLAELFSSIKDDFLLMKDDLNAQQNSEKENLSKQQLLSNTLMSELKSESEMIIQTISETESCIDENYVDESVLSETIKMEEERLLDLQNLCDLLYKKYDYLNVHLSGQTTAMNDIRSVAMDNSVVFD